jgi:hypothetical protein
MLIRMIAFDFFYYRDRNAITSSYFPVNSGIWKYCADLVITQGIPEHN